MGISELLQNSRDALGNSSENVLKKFLEKTSECSEIYPMIGYEIPPAISLSILMAIAFEISSALAFENFSKKKIKNFPAFFWKVSLDHLFQNFLNNFFSNFLVVWFGNYLDNLFRNAFVYPFQVWTFPKISERVLLEISLEFLRQFFQGFFKKFSAFGKSTVYLFKIFFSMLLRIFLNFFNNLPGFFWRNFRWQFLSFTKKLHFRKNF